MSLVTAFITLTRPLNVIIAGLSIALAAALVHPRVFCSTVLCAVISGMLITAGANAINDICDLEIDRINKPMRVLPSGRLSVSAAGRFTIILFSCGIIFSIFVGFWAVTIATGSTMLLIAYSLRLKRQPVIGNLAVSFSTALAFIYGALAACKGVRDLPETALASGDWRVGIFPAVFSFLFHFGREVVKDIEDQIGDRAVAAQTLPLAFGLKWAQITATIAFAALAIVVLVPYQLGMYHRVYIWIIALGILPILAYAILQTWCKPDVRHMHRTSNLLKAGMLVGLLAIFLGTMTK